MMVYPLLAKLQKPVGGGNNVSRTNLLQRLDQGLNGKVTLVAAPAGYGKTALISKWVANIDARKTAVAYPRYVTSWLTVDEGDNSFAKFIIYLLSAVQQSFPDAGDQVRQLIHQSPAPSIEAIADSLAYTLSQLDDPLVLVLDDLHLVTNPAIYSFLARLVQYAPPQLHLVLLSRVDPPLPLNRWRAQGTLSELRLRDLSFSLEETATFLGSNLRAEPNASLIESLHRRTEGWVVGLWLALLALQNHDDYAEFTSDIAINDTRYVADYLVDEVLESQPAVLKDFLVSTAILERFSSGLCAALLEIDEPLAQQHIRALEHNNLFMIAVDSSSQWYRYHHQFKDMLLSRLHMRHDQETIEALHRRAADWLDGMGYVDEALRHLTAIGDTHAAADLIEARRVNALNMQNFTGLDQWLGYIPNEILSQRPALLLTQAWTQQYQLKHRQCMLTAQRAEKWIREHSTALPEAAQQLLQEEINTLYLSVGDSIEDAAGYAATDSLVRETWSTLKTRLVSTHSNAVLFLAAAAQRMGESELAADIAVTAIETATEWPPIARCRVRNSFALNCYYDLKLDLAERMFEDNLHIAEQQSFSLISVLSHFGLALIARLRLQSDVAEYHWLAVFRDPYSHSSRLVVPCAYRLIELYVGQGKPEVGQEILDEVIDLSVRTGNTYLTRAVSALRAFYALVTGNMDAAISWAMTRPHLETRNSSDIVPLIHARILLTEGSQASLLEVVRNLEELVDRHERERGWTHWLHTIILQLLAWDKLGEEDLALAALGRAVELAVPNGVLAPFIEQGAAMERLLKKLRDQAEQYHLVERVLLLFGPSETTSRRTVAQSNLPDPLTDRELDVLQLLAQRLSNTEIAQVLVVSPHTVRNHTSNIYGKLQVENRREAVERARTLGLLVQAEKSIIAQGELSQNVPLATMR